MLQRLRGDAADFADTHRTCGSRAWNNEAGLGKAKGFATPRTPPPPDPPLPMGSDRKAELGRRPKSRHISVPPTTPDLHRRL